MNAIELVIERLEKEAQKYEDKANAARDAKQPVDAVTLLANSVGLHHAIHIAKDTNHFLKTET